MFTSPRAWSQVSLPPSRASRSHHVVVTGAFGATLPHARVHFARVTHVEIGFCLSARRGKKTLGMRAKSNFSSNRISETIPRHSRPRTSGRLKRETRPAQPPTPLPLPPPPPLGDELIAFVRLRKSVRACHVPHCGAVLQHRRRQKCQRECRMLAVHRGGGLLSRSGNFSRATAGGKRCCSISLPAFFCCVCACV